MTTNNQQQQQQQQQQQKRPQQQNNGNCNSTRFDCPGFSFSVINVDIL
jgi:hypothetical protein